MQVNVTFRHLDPSDSLKAFAKEKVEHVNKFLDHSSEANIVLSIEKHMHHAEILVHSGPFFLRSKEKSDDMYASIGLAMEKIERQIKRYKDRMRSHKVAGHHNTEAKTFFRQSFLEVDAPLKSEDAQTALPPASRVVGTNDLTAKKMSVDEAVLQLDIVDNDFLVFTNAETNHVAILYRRKGEKNYGLIDARPQS